MLVVFVAVSSLRCLLLCTVFFQLIRPQPTSTLFPYTTLFRSLRPRSPSMTHQVQLNDQEYQVLLQLLEAERGGDRKSTRLNSSHANISYAVFCLKKKNKTRTHKQEVQDRNHTANAKSSDIGS